mgnify:CR=1 FL=1|tara:strand:+ start:16639 stop:17205 length:567 start_codon:yes stop_codon:yes gene_type:complete
MSQAPYSLMAELAKVKNKGKPPIHLWNPENVKDIEMEIQEDGTWFYLGTPIERPRLVHLFASVLRLEEGDYYLVTPVEKCRIRVVDVPFQVLLLENSGEGIRQSIQLTTNMSECITLGPEHALRAIGLDGEEPAVYVMVRDGLEARLNRNVYYQLAELLVEHRLEGTPWLGIWSQGVFFPLIESYMLP